MHDLRTGEKSGLKISNLSHDMFFGKIQPWHAASSIVVVKPAKRQS
jgi:hypothetical protein